MFHYKQLKLEFNYESIVFFFSSVDQGCGVEYLIERGKLM